VRDTSTGDQGDNPGMQATPTPETPSAGSGDATPAQSSEGSEPRDSNE